LVPAPIVASRLYAPHASSSRLAKRASRLGLLAGRWLAEQGELILVGDLRAEHPQHPIQLLLFFVAILGSDRLPQAPSAALSIA
jgi:hypothetical protein